MDKESVKPVNIGLLGLGTVGCGTVNVLQRNAQELLRRAGRPIIIQHAVVRDLNKKRDCDNISFQISSDIHALIQDPHIDIVVELMGGTQQARDAVLSALDHGKHVITANKALIAEHGNEIFAKAQQKGVIVAFEAAVAGGIPIVKILREGLVANRINRVAAILNGTSNYILTQMQLQQWEFDRALQEAQAQGYAEADPSLDVNGTDIAHKLTILATLAYGMPFAFSQISVEGIERITQRDIQYAEELGYRIKAMGIATYANQGINLRVHPCLIPDDVLLAHVDGVNNAILVDADAAGRTLYYGPGAGAEATASAVVADLVEVVRALSISAIHRVPSLAYPMESLHLVPIQAFDDVVSANYLRLLVTNKTGVLADITQIFAANQMSIEAVLQKESDKEGAAITVVILTHDVPEAAMQRAEHALNKLTHVREPLTRIRLEHFYEQTRQH